MHHGWSHAATVDVQKPSGTIELCHVYVNTDVFIIYGEENGILARGHQHNNSWGLPVLEDMLSFSFEQNPGQNLNQNVVRMQSVT